MAQMGPLVSSVGPICSSRGPPWRLPESHKEITYKGDLILSIVQTRSSTNGPVACVARR